VLTSKVLTLSSKAKCKLDSSWLGSQYSVDWSGAWTTGRAWTMCTTCLHVPTYLLRAYCTTIKIVVGNLGSPDCCDCFQVSSWIQ